MAKTDLVLMTSRSCGPNNVFAGVSLGEDNTTCLKLKKLLRSPASGVKAFALRLKDSENINKTILQENRHILCIYRNIANNF
jgi:hypothetical protein